MNEISVSKEKVKESLLTDTLFSPENELMDFIAKEISDPDKVISEVLTNLFDKYDNEDLIKGIFLLGVLTGMDMAEDAFIEDEKDDFEEDICDCHMSH